MAPTQLLTCPQRKSKLPRGSRSCQLKRLAALFKHLRLGVTLVGMRELLEALPNDKLEQVNLEFRVARDEAPARPNWPWSARAAFRCFF